MGSYHHPGSLGTHPEVPRVSTCLWFTDQAEQAAQYYVSLVRDSRITHRVPDKENGAMRAVGFTLAGTPYSAMNGGPVYQHSPAISIVVTTQDQVETDTLWSRLLKDGGQSLSRGWVRDKFGVSWQVLPHRVVELMTSGDATRVDQMMRCFMGSDRLVIADLERAYGA